MVPAAMNMIMVVVNGMSVPPNLLTIGVTWEWRFFLGVRWQPLRKKHIFCQIWADYQLAWPRKCTTHSVLFRSKASLHPQGKGAFKVTLIYLLLPCISLSVRGLG